MGEEGRVANRRSMGKIQQRYMDRHSGFVTASEAVIALLSDSWLIKMNRSQYL
jgi:hypothetical protein